MRPLVLRGFAANLVATHVDTPRGGLEGFRVTGESGKERPTSRRHRCQDARGPIPQMGSGREERAVALVTFTDVAVLVVRGAVSLGRSS